MGNCCDFGQTDSRDNQNLNQPYQSTDPIMNQPGPNSQKSNQNKRKPANSKKGRKSKRKSSGNSNLRDREPTFANESEPTSSRKEEHPIKRKNSEDNKQETEKKPRLESAEETSSDKDKLFIEKLCQIREKATPFIKEIENFTELEDSNKYYYIEESLRRLIEKLDDMHDDLENNSSLRAKRKEVYKYIFPLFDKLDDKLKENRDRIA